VKTGNPYRPPGAAVDDVVPPAGAPVKAIVYGVLVDVGGSLAAGLAIAIVYSIALAASGVTPEEMQRMFSDPDPLSWPSLIGSLAGGAASFLGGYVCARVAAVREMRSVGVVAAVSGIVSLAMGSDGYPFEWDAVLALAGMAAVFAGGWLGTRKNRRRRA
jgi:peptidoglycan/LPS O-acetylase OafA/YrhL